MTAGNPLIPIDLAAHTAHVTPRTIRRWVATGRLTQHNTPHGPRYRLRDVHHAATQRATTQRA